MLCVLYILSTATTVVDFLAFTLEVSKKVLSVRISLFLSVMMQTCVSTLSPQPQIDSQSMLFRLGFVQIMVEGYCDFIAQCTLVRINHCNYHQLYSLKWHLQRSTVVGSCGVKISVSLSFLHSWQSHTSVSQYISPFDKPISIYLP